LTERDDGYDCRQRSSNAEVMIVIGLVDEKGAGEGCSPSLCRGRASGRAVAALSALPRLSLRLLLMLVQMRVSWEEGMVGKDVHGAV
jgi:hypothetical protein